MLPEKKGVLVHFLLWGLGLEKPWTFYNDAECRSLEKYAAEKKRLAEIGCWQGVNTSRLRGVMHAEGVLYAVDPYPAGRLGFNAAGVIAHREVSRISRGNVRWMPMTDLEAAAEIKRNGEPKFDFIFSDSSNDYDGFRKCWEAWSPLLMPQGIYILANSAASPRRKIQDAGSVRFTAEVILRHPGFIHLETVETFTVLRKK